MSRRSTGPVVVERRRRRAISATSNASAKGISGATIRLVRATLPALKPDPPSTVASDVSRILDGRTSFPRFLWGEIL